MPLFVCSYAHDIACFADFVVEAKSEQAALRRIRKALREGRFAEVDATPCWENGTINPRVFVQGTGSKYTPTTTLTELIGEEHRFSTHMRRCLRCGRHADDEAVKPEPCRAAPLIPT